MKIATIKFFFFVGLASAMIPVNADKGDTASEERTPATSKIEIAIENKAAKIDKSEKFNSEGIAVSEAKRINSGRQLKSKGATPANEKTYSDGKPLSE